MAVYRILKQVTDQGGTYYVSTPPSTSITTVETLQRLAKSLAAQNPGETLHLVQEIGTVAVEPVVTMTLELPTPKALYRDGTEVTPISVAPLEVFEVSDGPKRDPQAKPRLLILDRKATPAELVGNLMVVAEGRIVKNAFGALELEDMPLQGAEVQEVANALRRNMVV